MHTSPGTSVAVAVIVVADDLIWASRLKAAAEKAGAPVSTVASVERLIEGVAERRPRAVLVDLNGRSYDALSAIRAAAERGLTVLAVGQHEDVAARKAAMAAGARRALSYDKLFRDGPAVVAALLEGSL